MSRFHDEFFRQGSPDHDALMIKYTSEENIRKIIKSLNLVEQRLVSYETEVIIRNGPFIIGYADAVIKTRHINSKYDDDGIVNILIEAKPDLMSLGEVIRQLKTYKHVLEREHYTQQVVSVIITHSVLDEQAIKYLENEKIHVIRF